MKRDNAIVAIYKSRAEAEAAQQELQLSGFDRNKLSIFGALEGRALAGGISTIKNILWSVGIPNDTILRCELALTTDHIVLVAYGAAEEMAEARYIIHQSRPEGIEHIDPPGMPLPPRNERVIVICKTSRCLGYLDDEGKWRDDARSRELKDVISWIKLDECT